VRNSGSGVFSLWVEEYVALVGLESNTGEMKRVGVVNAAGLQNPVFNSDLSWRFAWRLHQM